MNIPFLEEEKKPIIIVCSTAVAEHQSLLATWFGMWNVSNVDSEIRTFPLG